MNSRHKWFAGCVLAFVAFASAGCGSKNVTTTVEPTSHSCDLDAQREWIERWFDAWELTSREILKLPDAPAPNFVFFDSACVYTTSQVSALGAPVVKSGPKLLGKKLEWRTTAHDGEITTPKGETSPVALMSYTDAEKKSGPFFVMAAPSYWEQTMKRGDPYGFTGVFLHEFTHTRQMKGVAGTIGPIDSAWAFDFELDDDAVQNRFGADSVYVNAYLEECDLLYKAADAATDAEAREIAKQALEMMHARHARYFTGENAVFSTLDNLWLSMEGAAQWAAYAWLSHPKGAGMDRKAAAEKMLGRRRWWAQDEGLALFLVIDRLMPEWPSLVFAEKSMGGIDLLERALQK